MDNPSPAYQKDVDDEGSSEKSCEFINNNDVDMPITNNSGKVRR